MKQKIAFVALMVNDYEEAITFYTQKLYFLLLEDIVVSEHKRWVVVAPPGATESGLLLAKASGDRQTNSIGD